jgi:hypothetical protein
LNNELLGNITEESHVKPNPVEKPKISMKKKPSDKRNI